MGELEYDDDDSDNYDDGADVFLFFNVFPLTGSCHVRVGVAG